MTPQSTAAVEVGRSVVTIPFTPPCRLSDLLGSGGVPFEAPCGGRQRCLRCRVVATGALSEPTERERAALTEADRRKHVRLACMTQALGDVHIRLLSGTMQVVTEGALPSILSDLPAGTGFGLAVDVGTTTLAGYLYDLTDRRLLATAACENPQRVFGTDVVSRVDAALHGQDKRLRQVIIGAIGDLQATVCEKAGISPADVGDRVIVGNTAMITILCGRSTASLAAAPFSSTHETDERRPLSDFGWSGPDGSIVHLPPCPAAFIGADTVAALLAADLFSDGRPTVTRPTLLADIGTNGELVLVTPDGLLACSAAAGPALEGAGIACGMVASTGAVSQVAMLGARMCITVIGGGNARGLCGSGLIDLIAGLGAAGVLDREGRLREDGHAFVDNVRAADGQPAFFLPDTDVCLTQDDVRAVQLAKGAIRAGIETLLSAAQITEGEVDRLLLAGGFGSRLSAPSAAAIGLIPPALSARTEAIGNAAGAGACRLLLDPNAAEDARAIGRQLRVLTLSDQPTFESDFIRFMRFDTFPRFE